MVASMFPVLWFWRCEYSGHVEMETLGRVVGGRRRERGGRRNKTEPVLSPVRQMLRGSPVPGRRDARRSNRHSPGEYKQSCFHHVGSLLQQVLVPRPPLRRNISPIPRASRSSLSLPSLSLSSAVLLPHHTKLLPAVPVTRQRHPRYAHADSLWVTRYYGPVL